MKHLRLAVIATALTMSIAACGSDKPANTTSAPTKATAFVLDE